MIRRLAELARITRVRDLIREFLAGEGADVVTSADIQALGCSLDVAQDMVRAKELVRLAKGTYVSAKALHPPPDSPLRASPFALTEHQHRLRLDAFLRRFGRSVAASHQSAVLAWGLPTHATSLSLVHLAHTGRGKTARRRAAYTLHTCELDQVITRHEGRRLVVPSLAVIGQALSVGLSAGVEAMDAAIRLKRTTRGDLEAMLQRMRHTPRLTIARRAVFLADGLAESPGETRLRLLLVELGVKFVAQHWVRIGDTAIHYRVDFYLPSFGVILEYDGKVKYGTGAQDLSGSDILSNGGQSALVSEKKREDDLRLDGFGVGRVTAADLTRAGVTRIIVTARKQALPGALHREAARPHWART